MCSCAEKVRISIGLADECVIPSGVLRGEVIVVVHPSCTDGIRYHRIRLELTGREHNAVRDDQGEFDALLDGYTSDRTYLSRHVTLSGRRKASEDVETALQRKQEVMFRQHHTAPYYRVIPVKPKEPKSSGGGDAKKKEGPASPHTATPATTAAAAAASPQEPVATPSPQKRGSFTSLHDMGDVEMQMMKMKSAPRQRNVGNRAVYDDDDDMDVDNVEADRRNSDSDADGGVEEEEEGKMEGARLGSDGHGIALPGIVLPKSDDVNGSSGNTRSSGVATGKEQIQQASAGTAPPLRVVQPPTVSSLERLEAQEECLADEAKARRRKAKELRLMPGRYAFPFSFRVPPWLPPSLYYSIEDSSGFITYSAKATVDFGPGKRDLTSRKRFYVLSAISRRQLVACHEEAIAAATTNPLPPLSALFQVFACSCLGNMCCLASHSGIEVEVALQCSRALVLADANATYQVFRDYLTTREDVAENTPGTSGQTGHLAGAFNGYDAFMERKYQAPEEDFTSPAAFVDKFLKKQQQHEKENGLATAAGFDTTTTTATNTTDSSSSSNDKGGVGGFPDKNNNHRSHAARLAAYREAKKEAMRQRQAEVEKALPLPIGVLPLLVRVHNGCVKREIPKVRVELRETIQVFKSLEMPRVFKHPLARYEYTVSIPPGDEVTFAARLQLPKQFRRRREDDAKLCPPPGVKTANISTSTEIVVSFPDLATYVEEEDWVNSVVQLAEAVDMSDEVLDLPVRYS